MTHTKHIALYVRGNIHKEELINKILKRTLFAEDPVKGLLEGAVYSASQLAHYIDEEVRHGHIEIDTGVKATLSNASSGEQRKALLSHILSRDPDFLILDNVFENIDQQSRAVIIQKLNSIADRVTLIQIINRRSDLLSFILVVYVMEGMGITQIQDRGSFLNNADPIRKTTENISIPLSLHDYNLTREPLVKLNKISVHYDERPILRNICWEIAPGEFWQLRGPNGSGKSTLLSMITGENPKAYGQDMILFGFKKGSGETVWQIKENIGYFAPAMTRNFDRQDTVLQMIISGFFDSVGLYIKPSDMQVQRANDWLSVLEMKEEKNRPFRLLPEGQQRIILIARAIVKHPPLLILDEPASGLDDESALLFTTLVNRIAAESGTAIIYVSHRDEPGLTPGRIFELEPGTEGSTGKIIR